MKYEGTFNGVPVYSEPTVPKDTVYMINRDYFRVEYPKRKNGQPDMRYSVNKLMRALGIPFDLDRKAVSRAKNIS